MPIRWRPRRPPLAPATQRLSQLHPAPNSPGSLARCDVGRHLWRPSRRQLGRALQRHLVDNLTYTYYAWRQ